jgi:hypothetical protein
MGERLERKTASTKRLRSPKAGFATSAGAMSGRRSGKLESS